MSLLGAHSGRCEADFDPDSHKERYVQWFPLKSWLPRLLEGWRVDPLSSYSHHDRYSVLLWRPDEP